MPPIPDEFAEYKHIGLVLGNMIDVIKMSMGDFGVIGKSIYTKDTKENFVFWIVWLIIALVTCIIFLNFIIAEASASYEKVNENINANIMNAKSILIAEAELLRPTFAKSPLKFPKYIIKRSVET